MLCENCNQNEATVHYREIVNGIGTEHHLCSFCAAKLDLTGYGNVLNSEFPFVKLLTGMLAAGRLEGQETDSPMQYVKCPKCGMTYEEFTEIGKFGCRECYSVFGPLIGDNMKKLQGSNQHRGKKYRPDSSAAVKSSVNKNAAASNDNTAANELLEKNKRLEELESLLKEAVMLENFEAAAKYRDEIRALKNKMEGQQC